ncbi:MAG: hypothetical protein IJF75_00570 [Clostridia bacterium]|nr:hypothetical protein [Clostridia bacterium]
MKKILSVMLVVALSLSCVLMLSACGKNSQVAGTYEMVSISGTVTMNGQTVTLSEGLYDYYRIILNDDGTAKVESKGAGNTSVIEQEGTWEYEDNKVKLRSTTSGITVVEEMDWEDGTITYVANQSAQGMTISMTLILEKQ